MYSWELKNYLEQRNYILFQYEYIYICKTCPQINHIKYNAFENKFELWTEDNNYFKIQVYYDEKQDN